MRRLLLATSVLAAAAIAAGFAGYQAYTAAGPLGARAVIVIPRGGLPEIAAALVADHVVRSALIFKASAYATRLLGPLHAGEFDFPAGVSMEGVLHILRFGRPMQHRITFVEGTTAAQIARDLAAAAGVAGDVAVPREGSILPETYQYERGETAGAILQRGRDAMVKALHAAWVHRAKDVPLRNEDEAVVLASVVEREARLTAERPMIARVFYNRLARGMRLQADATAAYVADGGSGVLGRELTHDDLLGVNSYNTYVVGGLPAGPICAPGAASIEAVLHPVSGDALYFVADGSGGHVFSSSLGGQDLNISQLRRLRR